MNIKELIFLNCGCVMEIDYYEWSYVLNLWIVELMYCYEFIFIIVLYLN